MGYQLAIDGDNFEKKYWPLFIQNEFPSYEVYWVRNIVPLTNRPDDIRFKSDHDLPLINKTAEDICNAQLHYTVFTHLKKVFDILSNEQIDFENFIEGMIRLCCAQDVAFELLERHTNPSKYDPWREKKDKQTGRFGGKEACESWKKNNSNPLQNIRDYRNHLIHGRMSPRLFGPNNCYIPKIGSEAKYLDWRKIFDASNATEIKNDFVPIDQILTTAWNETVNYLESQWKATLLK